MAILKLFWLGSPSIEYEGHPLHLEMRKALALLAYLSLSPQRPTRESLASIFWPEFDQQRALANLRRNLASLSTSLPSGILFSDRETAGLLKESLTIDVDDFHRLLSVSEDHAHAKDALCLECKASFENAVSLYRGDFLKGFNLKDCPEFDEWQFFQRDSLRAKFAGGLKRLVEYYKNLREWEKAIGYARLWVALDRLDEPAQRALISLLALSGQRWAARHQYEEFVQILRKELNQGPEAETVEILQFLQAEMQAAPKTTSGPSIAAPSQARILETLLKTKLYIPFSKGKKVYREHLLSKLSQIPDHALTVLSAPAGFGKTTALSEWIRGSSLPVAWVSLDDADNHQVRFLTYLITALRTLENEFGEETLALLQSPHPSSTQVVVTNLINGLEKITYPFVLVLDDFQNIQAESVYEVLALLIDYLPDNAHLVISTRVDPPLGLARLRAGGVLLEIRAGDLRFTTGETFDYINEIMGLEMSPADIAILDERTEGWAVGLQMAALSLQKSTDKSQTIKAFSGSNRYILDYLLEEVIGRQPKYVQDFLLQTSVLQQMSGPLCDAVTGIREWSFEGEGTLTDRSLPLTSQQILEYLERANLFVLSLDDERCWYRYHHLFADLLSVRLENYYPHLIKNIYLRASAWHEQNGSVTAAVRYALASKSYEYAAALIERATRATSIWNTGDLPLLLSWIDALPKDVLFLNPLMRLYFCASLYISGQANKSEQILEELGESLPEILKSVPNAALVEQTYLTMCIMNEAVRGNISRAVGYFNRLESIPGGDERMKTLGKNYVILAYYVAGDVEKALRACLTIPPFETLVAQGNTISACNTAKSFADIFTLQGRLSEAVDVCLQTIERCTIDGVKNPIVGNNEIPLAAILLERNELEMAENILGEGLGLLAKGSIRSDFGQGDALLAMIKQAHGDWKRALRLIKDAIQTAEYAEIPRLIHLLQAYQARIWLSQGEIELASHWASAYRLLEPVEYPHEIEDLTLAHVLVVQKRYAEACDLLENLKTKAQNAGRYGRLVEIQALLSLARFSLDRSDEAFDLLEEGLRLAHKEKYLRVYLDKGEPMRMLLESYKEKWGAEAKNLQSEKAGLIAYIEQILREFEVLPPHE